MTQRIELTWSLMHPTEPDVAYMREVAAAAGAYDVDSFEICGACHGLGQGLDGVIAFDAYPEARARRDVAAVQDLAGRLREIVKIAHDAGRPVLYWHREVTVPDGMIEAAPGLLDERGEFDLLGKDYQDLLRYKIGAFFEAVLDMDGMVLTLTESEYSVIHNSNPERYPPAKVVARIAQTFLEELGMRGKRFVLRSFGSIPEDYEDILAGAALLAGKFDFEVETKITPYDFSPFLRHNPFLRQIPGLRLSAEFDTLGEFLGAGRLPAANVERIVEDVALARSRGATRFAVRMDRVGRSTLRSAYGVNALAFTRAARDPGATAESVWREWAGRRWPGVEDEMIAIMRQGLEATKKTQFVDGHVIFHTNPPAPQIKWLKAGGIFAAFHPGASLANQIRNWGMLSDKTAPPRAAILAEKDEAVRLAQDGLRRLEALRGKLAPDEYDKVAELWRNGVAAAELTRGLCRCVCAYFDDMEANREDRPALTEAMAQARKVFGRYLSEDVLASLENQEAEAFYDTIERHIFAPGKDDIGHTYARPLWTVIQTLRLEYAAEFAERREWSRRPGVADFVVCGGLTDDWRLERMMHGSHATIEQGRPARIVGNRLFPNGYLALRLRRPAGKEARVIVRGEPRRSAGLRVVVDGKGYELRYGPDGMAEVPAPNATPWVDVRLEKSGREYPWVYGVGVKG
ncbi:MAG TPA: hypothetical protein P5137_09300 [Candidatus Brocadiia bacterium]|nr:hypothetical protein [Candidatus Brocadiia bacterium]